MGGSTIIRVFCVDGPLRGIQFLDEGTGRILTEESAGRGHLYHVDRGVEVFTDFGRCPAARFDRTLELPA